MATNSRLGGEPIAVVGMACRLPKAHDVRAFWKLLADGIDAIGPVPADRWRADSSSIPNAGGFLDQVDQFDPQIFGISPREAVFMDPQQRLVLELAWEALEDTGIAPRGLEGSATGVFLGAMWNDYARTTTVSMDVMTQHTATGQDPSIIAGRVSYVFGLRGPSLVINTASSSSLVAIHYAAKSILMGECDLALAGGVNLILAPESMALMSKFGATASDARSKAFDARADGYGRGEGAGIVVLKPLSRAIADNDTIHCVILGSAVNNDGMSRGLSAPSREAQEHVLRTAYSNAGIEPTTVHYVETHGSGTKVGDPIEAYALGAVLGARRLEHQPPVRLGSVKTNIGHLESAAGIAGFIKAALVLKHRSIPPNLHFVTPNPEIPFDDLRLHVARTLEPWPDDVPPVAGVSSFGFGGTNCHVVLGGAPEPSAKAVPTVTTNKPMILPLSAHSFDALRERARVMAEYLDKAQDVSLSDIAFTASVRRSHLSHRLALIGANRSEVIQALAAYGRGELPPEIVESTAVEAPKVVFVFPGQGSQWIGMGRQLYREEPVFRDAINACDSAIRQEAGFSVVEELDKPEETSRVHETLIAQPALFAMEVALSALLQVWGVKPSAVIGHSVGEIAAAHVAGKLDLAQAARLVCIRARVMQRVTGHGKMVSVSLDEHSAAKAIVGLENHVGIAAVNDPNSVVLSGDIDAIDSLVAKLTQDGVQTRPLRVNYAFHSPQMEPLLAEFQEALADFASKAGIIPMHSTVTGTTISDNLDAAYWARNIRETVRLENALSSAVNDRSAIVVEVGPHPVLTMSMEQTLATRSVQAKVISTLRRKGDERESMLSTIAVLFTRGVAVHWKSFFPGRWPCCRIADVSLAA